MFRTSTSDQHPITSLVSHQGVAYWTLVEVTRQLPWFLVQVTRRGDDQDLEHDANKSFIVPEERVLDLVRLQDIPRLWIESISIISPGYMNDSAGWQMNPLAAIWTAAEPDEPSREATLYELGQR